MTQYGDLLRLGYFQDKSPEEREKILAEYEGRLKPAPKSEKTVPPSNPAVTEK